MRKVTWQLCTSHKLVRQRTLQEFELFDKNLYLMSLFYNRTVVHYPEVMKALYGIQFTARISCIILRNRSIPQLFCICYVHVRINQTIMQNNTYHASHEVIIGILNFLLYSGE